MIINSFVNKMRNQILNCIFKKCQTWSRFSKFQVAYNNAKYALPNKGDSNGLSRLFVS